MSGYRVLHLLVGAEGRNRTGTDRTVRGILSPLRLPIPPPRHDMPFSALEAAIGIEPMNRGFADLRLSHLATPPLLERETGLEPATPTLARLCSTTELLPRKSVQI